MTTYGPRPPLTTAAVFFLIVGLVIIVAAGAFVVVELFLRGSQGTMAKKPSLSLVGLYVLPFLALILLLAFLLHWRTLSQAWVAAICATGILCLLAWKQDGQLAAGIVVPLDLLVLIGLFGVLLPLVLLLRAEDQVQSLPERLGLKSRSDKLRSQAEGHDRS